MNFPARCIMNRMYRLLLLLALAVSPVLHAQLHPLPGAKDQPPVICAGCVGNNSSEQSNAGLPTWPYPPSLKFVGRYVDSSSTASFQNIGFRTARAGHIRTAGNRIYIQLGSGIGTYTLDKFFAQKLPAGTVSVGGIKTGARVGGSGRNPLERIVMPDGLVYPEAKGTGWLVPFQDGQDRLGAGAPFDVDDRGFIYAAYRVFGWGILKDDGRENGQHFETLVQMIAGGATTSASPRTRPDNSGVTPDSIIALKVGGRYYAVVADQLRTHAVWDVTVPTAPVQVAVRRAGGASKFGIRKFDRSDAVQRLAYVGGDHRLYVYDYAAFISGQAPVVDHPPRLVDVSFDESGNVWAAERFDKIWRFSVAGQAYNATAFTPHAAKFEHEVMHAAQGFVVVGGVDFTGRAARDTRLLRIEAGGLVNVDLGGFFRKYYHQAPAGFAQPGNTGVLADVQIVRSGGKTYLMLSTFGIGDVYLIEIAGVVTPPDPPAPPVVTPPKTCTCTCPCT